MNALAAASRLLFLLARSKGARRLTGWVFANMSFALPVDRLYESQTIIAFFHPRPSYAVHILIVPRREIASPAELTEMDASLLGEVFALVSRLVREMNLQQQGYRVITNGGPFQSLPQLHFHLISGAERA